MRVTSRSWLAVGIASVLASSSALAQTDYSTKTLNFSDLTATNVNATVAELTTNEKEVEFGDYDNDGDLDVVMAVGQSDFGQRRNKLFRNDGGVLNEVSGSPVIPGFSNTDVSRSVYFRDYDLDGFLDIVVLNDSNSGTSTNDSPGKTKYYRNVGGTSFVNESQRLDNITGAACNGCSADFDGNGYCDLMMCNYPNTTQDALDLNNINGAGPGQMTNVTSTNMPAEGSEVGQLYGVHAECADMNGDGKLDLLVASRTNNPAYIYYNDNEGAGSGPGDFRYNGTGARSVVNNSIGGASENAMVPADFNNDGLMDMYFANHGSGLTDAILINTGNDSFNRAQFTVLPFFSSVNGETHKINCTDLDQDGKVDLIVMADTRRPYIFRNTSENGEVSFLEWTPSFMTTTHRGWHAKAADITGNGRPDIVVGARDDDFLFENVPANLTDIGTDVSAIVPSFAGSDSVAIKGTITDGQTVMLFSTDIPIGTDVSVLVRSSNGDVNLNVTNNGNDVAGSNRKGIDVDEAVQFNTSFLGTTVFELTGTGVLLGDVNGDGTVNLLDVSPFVQLLSEGGSNPAGDLNGDGSVNLLDVGPFVEAINNGGGGSSPVDYVVEFLGR